MMFNQAKQALDLALKDKDWTGCLEQTQDYSRLPPAVILDIDETVLDNSPFQGEVAKRDAGYNQDLWTKWVNLEKCEGVPGAFNFIDYAQLNGVTVFFITNRDCSVETATRNNLARFGVKFPGSPKPGEQDTVLMQNENDWKSSDKSARRAFVAATHRILLLIGDDLGDFISVAKASPDKRMEIVEPHSDKLGSKWFLLPNPAYGSWDSSLYNYQYGERYETLKMKWNHLKGFK
jgi:acid phosphatase